MFDGDLILAFGFMGLLFLRQISILKQPNKINYSPLMIGIGAISSVVHFIIHPEATDTLLILRESFFPLLVSLLLYIVMNIMHQTMQTEQVRTQHGFTKALIEQITQLKQFTSDLEKRMIASQEEDRNSQKEVQEKFQQDIKALDAIQINQGKFLEKFDELDTWHKDVSKAFVDFTEVQLPSLDNVVHKHIDILRIEEQDHFNKVKDTLAQAVNSRCDILEDMEDMKKNLQGMKDMSKEISNSIVRHTVDQLSGVTKAFEKQVISLKSHTEGIGTSLSESETKLDNIRDKSEMIMKQMLLSSKKMTELENQNSSLNDLYSTIKELVGEVEEIKSDYVKSQSQLYMLSKELKQSQEDEINSVREQMEDLIVILTTKIDNSLEKLHNHYHIASEDLSKSVQELTKKAQMKKGYSE